MKWEKLVKAQEAIEQATAGELQPHVTQAHQLRLLLEIHGDLDQIALALRDHTKIASTILSYWEVSDQRAMRAEERAVRAEQRAVEAHAMMLEVGRLGVERENRTALMEAENASRYAEWVKRTMPTASDDGSAK